MTPARRRRSRRDDDYSGGDLPPFTPEDPYATARGRTATATAVPPDVEAERPPGFFRRIGQRLDDLRRTVLPLPDEVIKALRAATRKVLEEGIAKDPVTRKVHDSYFAFKAKYDAWAGYSEAVYHSKIRGA